MPRKNLLRSSTAPYFVTTQAMAGEWSNLSISHIWNCCMDSLKLAKQRVHVEIQAFVLLEGHYQLLLWTPNENLDRFMFEFNRTLSKKLRLSGNGKTDVFAGRYKWSLLSDPDYHPRIVNYMFQSPVRENIIDSADLYPFSTFYYYSKDIPLGFNLYRPLIGMSRADLMSSIIDKTSEDQEYRLKLALSRPVFRMPSERTMRRHTAKLS
jgi:putative transposase